jgi:alkaline phosphatase D
VRRSSVPTASGLSLYRRLAWGRLVTLHLLDTRQYRDDQACGDNAVPVCAGRLPAKRQMLGVAQEKWLRDGLAGSTATWDVLAQQVLFAQLDRDPGPGQISQMDAWDGYPAARRRVLDMLVAGDRGGRRLNPVVLTGDEHRNYASDLYRDFGTSDRGTSGRTPVGVELVTTSISSSGNGVDADPETDRQLATNPHLRFANTQRGYVLTRFDGASARTDFRVVPYVDRPGAPISTRASFAIAARNPGLHPA